LKQKIFRVTFYFILVIGIASILFPLVVERRNFIWDWSWLMVTTLVLLVFSLDLQIKTYEGVILLCLYVAFIVSTWRNLKHSPIPVDTIEVDTSSTTLKNTLFIILGLIGLVVGTRLALKGGVQIGELMGLSDRFIGLVILAAGTSMPELVTSIVAASKGHNDIAIANVTGSNLANILICLGLSSTLSNYTISERVLNPDVLVVLASTVLLGALVWIGNFNFKRWQGFALLTFYGTYFYTYVL
jgi:cation:H+ antiporter